MALREVRTFPDPVLKEICRPVDRIDDRVRNLARDMIETMRAAPGVGLAAPQVGEPIRLITMDLSPRDPKPEHLIVLINPRVIEAEGEQTSTEGCLSLPEFQAEVKRANRVVVEGLDLEGEPIRLEHEGLLAVISQHEIDHLDGTLLLDRISSLKRNLYKNKVKKETRRQQQESLTAKS
jgi:peptide deformylase